MCMNYRLRSVARKLLSSVIQSLRVLNCNVDATSCNKSYIYLGINTEEVDVTVGPSYQDTGKPGPGSMPLQVNFSPGTEASRALAARHASGASQIFNLYMGQQTEIYDATSTGVAIAKIVIETSAEKTLGTLTGGVPPWGTATDYGSLAVGHVVEVATALWRVDGVEDDNYSQATKLRLSPVDGAADVGTAADYRIFNPVEVIENWLGHVVDMSGFSFDASSPVVDGTVSIAPTGILSVTMYKPLAWQS